MASKDRLETFVNLLTDHQLRLHAFVRVLMGDSTGVADVVQETNLVLWRKADDFEVGTDFFSWACTIARFQVMAYLRNAKRDRLLFDDEVLAELALDAELVTRNLGTREAALNKCLEKLPRNQRSVITARYADDKSIDVIATEWGRSFGAVAMILSRARQSLFTCIEKLIAGEVG
jgi:RNA polymerase sigma-70 factor (ECF subfamily)